MTASRVVSRPVLLTRIGAPAALVGAACYSSFLLSFVLGPNGSSRPEFISELEVPGQPWSWLYRLTDVIAGLAILLTAAALWLLLKRLPAAATACVLLAVSGVGSVVDGLTSMRCDGGGDGACTVADHTAGSLLSELSAVHTDSGLAGLLGIAAAAVLLGRLTEQRWPVRGRLSIALGLAVAGTGLLDLVLLLLGHDIGVAERTRTLLSSCWLVLLSGFFASRPLP